MSIPNNEIQMKLISKTGISAIICTFNKISKNIATNVFSILILTILIFDYSPFAMANGSDLIESR